jgi:ketosteroid isomerase-like protein
MPYGKASIQKWLDHDIKTNKTLILQISPVAIQVYGSFAFVHYYYNGLVKDAEGKDKASSGRWTDILTKQGDRWVVIGDHGGQTSKD